MKMWSIYTNSYYNFGGYSLREAPWYIFAAQWLNFFLGSLILRITFHSHLALKHCFYRITVPIFRMLQKRVKTVSVKADWDTLISKHPVSMKNENERSLESTSKRMSNPNFNWDEYNQKKLEYSPR